MASVPECEQAMHTLAERLEQTDPKRRRTGFDRTLSCTLRDLDTIFAGRFENGLLVDIRTVDNADAQIRLALSSDDLVALVGGRLNVASALATGRLKIDAGMLDLVRLKSIF